MQRIYSYNFARSRNLGACGTKAKRRFSYHFFLLAILIAGSSFFIPSLLAANVSIGSISPSTGAINGSTTVELTGAGFTPNMAVWFGAQEAPIVNFVSANQVYVRPPAHAAGMVEVGIIESQSDLVRLGYAYTYSNQGTTTSGTPALQSVTPSSTTANTAISATLGGTNFQANSQVRVAGKYAQSVQVVSPTQIHAVLPAMSAGSYTVEVVNPNNTVASLNNAVTYGALLSIVTTGLMNATVGKPYNAAFDATGGTPPYVWSLQSGSLPAGLNLNSQGTVSGSPVKAASSYFTVKVTDKTGAVKTQASNINALAAPGAQPSDSASGTGISSCQAITNGGSYYLKNDVTCTSQGFALNADNISFNLNGHTITYGSPNAVVPAFSVCDQWYTQLPTSACGSGHHAAAEIYNGKIIQASNSAAFTPAIWLGEANGLSGGSIHDLTITIQQPGAQVVHGDFPGIGWKIQNNTINDNVTNIQKSGQTPLGARAQFQGVPIRLDNGQGEGSGDVISGNTINGSPQGAIADSNQNTQIYNNVIHLTSEYSNDYGITVLNNSQNVYDNVITGRGRGIDAESSQFTLQGNTIDVHEEANNSEYGGCELGGSDGIRVKNYAGQTPSTGWTIANNTVKVEGTICVAHGLRFTDLSDAVAGTVTGNTFTVTGTGSFEMNTGTAGDYALSLSGVDNPSLTYSGNTFSGDVCAQIDSDGTTDGADTSVQAGQTWSCGKYAADDIDLTGTGGGQYAQSLTIGDSPSNKAIYCGPYAKGLIKVGSTIKQCGQ